VLYSEASIILTLLFSLFSALLLERLDLFVYLFCGNLFASYFSGRCEKRSSLLRAGLLSSLFTSLVIVLLSLLSQDPYGLMVKKSGLVFVNGLLSSSIVLALLPVIEQAFDYVTDIRLIELSDFEHPLLEELMLKAPGTYHHSILVGTLAKAAAESIGAHPLLARAASYFHDIGKLKMPQYFVENRKENSDPHRDLSPHMSALILLSHVKEGVELARSHRLGRRIVDIIAEHHGTCLLAYFYEKAKEKEDPELALVEEKDFRYPGPKPQTKEAGIVMLADQVEASSRVLEDPTPKRIESHVRQVIQNVFLDGQLDECELTLRDLHAIERSFVNILLGIFHQRIEYPKRVIHGGADKRRAKGEETRKGQDKKDLKRLDGLVGS
jgi:putative nucleotidyltransferase with HDIG domain